MGGLRRPVRARRPPARLAAGAAAQPKINKKKAARATPAADKTTPPKDVPMVEVPLDAVKAPASGGIVDAVPAAAVVHDLDEGAAVGGTSPKIWSKQLVKITCPKFGTIWPVGKLLSTIHAREQQMGMVLQAACRARERVGRRASSAVA